MIAHLESEFSILKNERDQAQKIVSDIYAKLQVADKEYKVGVSSPFCLDS